MYIIYCLCIQINFYKSEFKQIEINPNLTRFFNITMSAFCRVLRWVGMYMI